MHLQHANLQVKNADIFLFDALFITVLDQLKIFGRQFQSF